MKKKLIKIIVLILIITITLISLYIISFNLLIKMHLVGNDVVNISYGKVYHDEGINVYFNKKDISSNLKIESNINYDKIGSYYIKYTIKYLGVQKSTKRIINVIDDEKPIITLKGSNPQYITVNNQYIESGYDVSDNYDKNIKVEVLDLEKLNIKP